MYTICIPVRYSNQPTCFSSFDHLLFVEVFSNFNEGSKAQYLVLWRVCLTNTRLNRIITILRREPSEKIFTHLQSERIVYSGKSCFSCSTVKTDFLRSC